MIETGCEKLPAGSKYMNAGATRLQSWTDWQRHQLAEIRSERALRLAADDEIGAEVCDLKLTRFEQILLPRLAEIRKRISTLRRPERDALTSLENCFKL